MLDEAHLGDIEGAFGRVRLDDDQRSGLRRRLITFLAIIGPGIIVMVGDNDAGGVSTYAQAGQDYGYTLLWTLLLLIPVLIINQEMVVRLGAVTGVGHARLINERFGRFWGWFSVGDLFLLNFLTIVTEFIGISLALRYFGVTPYISVPVTAVVLVGITASGSFARWERAMFVFIAVSLLLVPLVFTSHPHWGSVGYHFVVPGVQGGVTSTAVLLIIAIVGTTVAPWQLFFQQSNVIDKRITPRFIPYERADTTLGAFVVVIGAAGIVIVGVFAATVPGAAGHFTDALGTAMALKNTWAVVRRRVLDRAARRQHHRRLGRHAVHQLRVRRRVRDQALAAPLVQGRQAVLRQLQRDDRGVGGHRADPRRAARAAHHVGAGPRRHPAAERVLLPAAALQ